MKVVIKKSPKAEKKLMAIFYDIDTSATKKTKKKYSKKVKTIHFGAAGMSDFTKHKDVARKQRYMNRHKKNEYWDNPMTAGALSRWILWNKPTLRASIADYKKRFNLM